MKIVIDNNCNFILICSDCKEIVTLLNQEKEATDLYAYALSACREYQ